MRRTERDAEMDARAAKLYGELENGQTVVVTQIGEATHELPVAAAAALSHLTKFPGQEVVETDLDTYFEHRAFSPDDVIVERNSAMLEMVEAINGPDVEAIRAFGAPILDPGATRYMLVEGVDVRFIEQKQVPF